MTKLMALKVLVAFLFLAAGVASLYASAYVIAFHLSDWWSFPTTMLTGLAMIGFLIGSCVTAYSIWGKED